jgi:hypothetical protein
VAVSSRSNLCAVSPVPAMYLRSGDLIRITVEHPPHIALHSDGVVASMRNKIQDVCGGSTCGTVTLTVYRV